MGVAPVPFLPGNYLAFAFGELKNFSAASRSSFFRQGVRVGLNQDAINAGSTFAVFDSTDVILGQGPPAEELFEAVVFIPSREW